MGTKTHNSRGKIFMIYLILISLSLFGLILPFKPLLRITSSSSTLQINLPSPQVNKNPKWLRLIRDYLPEKKIRVGFLNIDEKERESYEARGPLILKNVYVSLDPIPENVTWKSLYPEWIDEKVSNCPDIPLPQPQGSDADVDVIVARVPCDGWSESKGLRDVFRLQVNLAVANLAVQSGMRRVDSTVYVVFIGSCGPMHEIFRCDERVRRVENYWVYKPYIPSLKQKLLMPVGSCRVAPPFAQLGQEAWRPKAEGNLKSKAAIALPRRLRVAYVTVLHSSESYVCGAIALAQSIRQSGSHKDMILLHDQTITNRSLIGLSAAGWNLRLIDRICSPFSKKDSYNEWNYSKLRVWQVTDYDKLVFIDADFIILKKLDYLFYYPQISASGNDKVLFNSGIMVLEPSACMFKELMEKSFKIESYNGGDQGFLNEIFVWWHRLSKRVNTMKYFDEKNQRPHAHDLPENLEGVHYLGLKPWVCYRDYDCNWDMSARRVFASDSVHKKWWKVYDKMSEQLKGYCSLNKNMEKRIEKWREIAKNNSLPDRHWEIEVRDPRKTNLLVQ
ncbi:PREDICTED: putative UDP-glucuronate:xylan alpha-glucuronosyltransferase 4 isoform X2 [Camelina sativa]|uniref:Hexosyltransferase n=1 Tax=Camelina sativa TaxID=90675 RepID=A0ABM0Z6T2_CAMSA|nr:PREDICTED: putative UDP-glucuronate:xylan alpha-glucuronosyltransferase 4 isoform X2 [Camelina sativa]